MNTSSSRQEWSSASGQERHASEVGGSSQPQEWCLHAQLTISHPKAEPVRTTYVATGIGTGTPKDKWTTTGSNIQFQYSWSNCDKERVTEIIPEPGIQKFESWPKSLGGSSTWPTQKFAADSGYNTEQNFVGGVNNPVGASSSPKIDVTRNKPRVIQPYARRCISTCTITLSNEGLPNSKFSFSSENLANLRCSSDISATHGPAVVSNRVVVKDAGTQTSPIKTVNEFTSITVNPDTSNVTVLNNASSAALKKYQLGGKETTTQTTKQVAESKDQAPAKLSDHSSRASCRTSASRRAKSSPPIRYQQKLV